MEGWSLGIGRRGTLEKVHPIWAALPLFSLLSSTMHDSRRPALYSYLEVLTQLCLLPKAPTLSLAMSSFLLLLCGPCNCLMYGVRPAYRGNIHSNGTVCTIDTTSPNIFSAEQILHRCHDLSEPSFSRRLWPV